MAEPESGTLAAYAMLEGPDHNSKVFQPSCWVDSETCEAAPLVSLTGWNNLSIFSEGSHLCIGYHLAVFKMKVFLVVLVRALQFKEVQGVKIKKRNLFMMQPLIVENTSEAKDIIMEGPWFPVKILLIDQD